jgi:hypothetical protein
MNPIPDPIPQVHPLKGPVTLIARDVGSRHKTAYF